jgi:hypothetical protein
MSNVSFWLWIALSAGLMLLFAYAAWVSVRRRNTEADLDEIIPFLRRVDLDGFSRLLNPIEDRYIRENRGDREDQKYRRKQIRIAMESLRRMSHNAALMQTIGYSRLESRNPLVAEQAQALVDAGVHVRLYSLMGMATLHFWRLLGFIPTVVRVSEIHKLVSTSAIPAYEVFRMRAAGLTDLRESGFRDALLQSL